MVDTVPTPSGSSEARFYAEQARREQAAADSATLANVRDKHQRSASAWSLLAGRASARDAGRAPKDGSGLPGDVSGLQVADIGQVAG